FASLGVAAAIVALHFIVTRRPRAAFLPTARFVPDTRATTVAKARRPSDLLLMLLRILVVIAAGAGLAKPVLTPSRGAEARVILVDVSRSGRDSMSIRDSVRATYRAGDGIVVFDSSARLIAGNVGDTIGALRPSDRRGNLSAALIAALRAGSSLRERADSLELVIVSPFAREELDAATDSIRALWPGKARLVRIRQVRDTVNGAGKLETNADANDPMAITVGLAQDSVNRRSLIDRTRAAKAPSTSSPGGALIAWPASTRPRFAVQRAVRDTVGGVTAGESVVVSAFERQWSFPADSLRGGEVIARWIDGDPAAIEKSDGAGCVRSVAVPVSLVGDLAIRKDFVRFVASLSGPCSRMTSLISADPSVLLKLEGKGGLAPRAGFQPLSDARSDLAPWLFALAIVAAIAELFVRQRVENVKALGSSNQRSPGESRAA
ncbi:MAG: hypothetical protein QOD47_1111, partial [Gemmatimonadaceae bacterium]|nr:hypothetical protein [Gemmatimonadaceae bacterium]